MSAANIAAELRAIARAVSFIETNDLVVLKILASREKDLEDVRALLRSQSPEIDRSVVRARLRELGDLLDDSTLESCFDEQVARSAKARTRKPKHAKTR